MAKETFILKNNSGFHARPAGVFVKTANCYESEVFLIKDDTEYNGKSIMGLLSMGAGKGTEITVKIEGPDETEAMTALLQVLETME